MTIIKKIVLTLIIAIPLLFGALIATLPLLPAPYAVNISWGDIAGGATQTDNSLHSRLSIPDEYSISLFASGLGNARFMRLTSEGDLLLSIPRSGKIVLLKADLNNDGQSDQQSTVIEGLNKPHGLDLFEGWLYIAETNAIGRIRFDQQTGKTQGSYKRLDTTLPGGGNHWTRTLKFGPDSKLYVSAGSSCNACEEDHALRATMFRYNADGSDREIIATGLRNSVGFDWAPNGELYATENSRDLLGDDIPPDELNLIIPDQFYGWPVAWGDKQADPDFGSGQALKIAESIPPAHNFRAHNAPLGMTFLNKPRSENVIMESLVALHGSWNRSVKDGYKIVSLQWQSDGSIIEEDFISGFEYKGDVIGRPVDVVEDSNGTLYISDDYSGSVYRVTKGKTNTSLTTLEIQQTHKTSQPVVSLDSSQLKQAQQLYQTYNCQSCHNSNLKPLENLSLRYDRDSLAVFLETPASPMPVFPFKPGERLLMSDWLLQEYP